MARQRPKRAAAWHNKGLLSPKTGKNLFTGRKWGSWLVGVIPLPSITWYAAYTYVARRQLACDNVPPISMVVNRCTPVNGCIPGSRARESLPGQPDVITRRRRFYCSGGIRVALLRRFYTILPIEEVSYLTWSVSNGHL